MLGPDAATREPRRLPGPRERGWWCWRASRGTGGCSMPAISGRSPRSPRPPGLAATTTPTVPAARRITKRSAPRQPLDRDPARMPDSS
jgi:hypothetical protein